MPGVRRVLDQHCIERSRKNGKIVSPVTCGLGPGTENETKMAQIIFSFRFFFVGLKRKNTHQLALLPGLLDEEDAIVSREHTSRL